MYQARKACGHAHWCLSMLPLFTIFWWILELYRIICFFHFMSSISIIFTMKLFIHYTVCTVLKSGWWSDCCLLPKWVIFQLYHCANKLHFNEMMSAVHYTNTLRWILLVISHWNDSPRGRHDDKHRHIILTPISLCSYSSIPRAYSISSKYQFHKVFGLIRPGLLYSLPSRYIYIYNCI